MALGEGSGEERIPDHPGIHAAPIEGGPRVGRSEINRCYIPKRDPSGGERPNQQIMHVGTAVQGNALALQLRERGNSGVVVHDDRLCPRRRRLRADIDQWRAGGLREDGRRLAGMAEINGADIERLQ